MLLSEVDELRGQLTSATTLASEDAAAYARSIADESPEKVAAQIKEAVPALVESYGGVAAEAGALFYETQRPTYRPAEIAPPSIGDVLMHDLGYALVPLFNPDGFDVPLLSFVSLVSSVTQKHAAAGMRDTIVLSSSNDPDAYGVRRYARANACAFCRLLSVQEADVTESTVWHRNCHCVTVPWWEDNPLPENPYEAGWRNALNASREELLRLQRELKPAGMRWRNFFKAHPELAVNNKNLARLMRVRLGIQH